MFHKLIPFFLLILFSYINISNATYSDCGSKDGSLVSVTVTNCAPTARRCLLKRNTNVTISIDFKSQLASDSLTAVVHGIIMDVPIIFNLPNNNGCVDSGVQCPIAAGNTYKYISTMPVSSSYPRVTVDVKWELQDATGKDITCALIPAKIV